MYPRDVERRRLIKRVRHVGRAQRADRVVTVECELQRNGMQRERQSRKPGRSVARPAIIERRDAPSLRATPRLASSVDHVVRAILALDPLEPLAGGARGHVPKGGAEDVQPRRAGARSARRREQRNRHVRHVVIGVLQPRAGEADTIHGHLNRYGDRGLLLPRDARGRGAAGRGALYRRRVHHARLHLVDAEAALGVSKILKRRTCDGDGGVARKGAAQGEDLADAARAPLRMRMNHPIVRVRQRVAMRRHARR